MFLAWHVGHQLVGSDLVFLATEATVSIALACGGLVFGISDIDDMDCFGGGQLL